MKRNVLSWRRAARILYLAVAGIILCPGANTLSAAGPSPGRWEERRTAPLAPRWLHTAVWNGNEMLVWGGGASAGFFNDGARYNPATDQWTGFSPAGAPSRRWAHAAAWTGSEMLVWGGSASFFHTGTIVGDGARYAPGSDTWRPMAANGAPSGRCGVCAVWTGSEFVIWGGRANDGSTPASGARYNPATDTWRPISTLGAPGGRFYGTAVWTGREMIVWGGQDSALGVVGTGGRYDPVTDTWSPVSLTGAPSRRFIHVAAWTGAEMIVSGGTVDAFNPINGGGIYNPSTDSWRQLESAGAPTARHFASAVWSGSEMIVWGGGNPYYNDGAKFDPIKNQWTSLAATSAAPRAGQSALWTGNMMLIFGGASGRDFNDTYAYFSDSDASGPNTTPSVSLLPGVGDQVIAEDGDSGPIGFVVFDRETPAERLTARGVSSNQALVPDGNVMIEGTGAGRNVRVRPLSDRFGSARITITVTDPGGLTGETGFNLLVQPVNDPPVVTGPAEVVAALGTSPVRVQVSLADTDTLVGNLVLAARSFNPDLIPSASITVGSVVAGAGGHTGVSTISITPLAGRTGQAQISLTVSDGTDVGNLTFNVIINQSQTRQVRVVPVSGAPGSTVAVPIELVASGDENAIGLTLVFPESLTYLSAKVGANAASATLNASASSLSPSGSAVGLVLALPSGQTFPAGTQQVMVLSFRIELNGTGLKTIVPASTPVAMEVAGVDANPLPATFLGSAITIVTTEYEADVAPRPKGSLDGSVTVTDWVQVGRFVTGLDVPSQGEGGEFRRVDCAPRGLNGQLVLGNGVLSVSDWVQAGRYAAGLDPVTEAGGPASPVGKAGFAGDRGAMGKAALAERVLSLVPRPNGVVAVELAGQGDEAGVGFSLTFDATAWGFVEATLASQLANVTLQVNGTLASDGKVGVALVTRGGDTLGLGASTLVLLRFEPRSTVGGTVSFGDDPVRREIANSTAEELAASYQGSGTRIVAGPGGSPSISIRRAGAALFLSVNGELNGWLLEESGNLTAENWRVAPSEGVLDGGAGELRIDTAAAARFFRLRAR